MREEILQQIIDDLPSIRVEFSLILGAISVLIVGLIRPRKALIKTVYAACLLLAFYLCLQPQNQGSRLSLSLYIDPDSVTFSFLFLLCGLVLLFYKRR
ncbi:MAG: hypothetical protein AAFY41_19760 [Bacteroidota bacterium]